SYTLGYPQQVIVGGRLQNAGYVQIPYVRPDSFTVVFAHTRRGIVSGPDSVTIPKGLTYSYFDINGDSLGADTISIARATGYHLKLQGAYLTIPDYAPDTVHVTLTRQLPLVDSLNTFTVTIPKGQYYSSSFDMIALDSAGIDTVTAVATGYVSDRKAISAVP